jgi:hypothetical protein
MTTPSGLSTSFHIYPENKMPVQGESYRHFCALGQGDPTNFLKEEHGLNSMKALSFCKWERGIFIKPISRDRFGEFALSMNTACGTAVSSRALYSLQCTVLRYHFSRLHRGLHSIALHCNYWQLSVLSSVWQMPLYIYTVTQVAFTNTC